MNKRQLGDDEDGPLLGGFGRVVALERRASARRGSVLYRKATAARARGSVVVERGGAGTVRPIYGQVER